MVAPKVQTLTFAATEIKLRRGMCSTHNITVLPPVRLGCDVILSDDDVIALRDALNDLLPEGKRYKRPVYKYRSYRLDCTSRDKLWCVTGGEVTLDGRLLGGGVLEWCTSEEDANAVLAEMLKCDSPRGKFENLRAEKYT